LSGAKFKIADTEANAKAGNYLRKTADGAVVDPSDSRWASATDWEATSASDGTFSFDGVEDYTSVVEKKADGTYAETKTYCSYYLVETQAPDGYNLPDSPFKIEFTEATSKEDTNWTISKDVTNTNEFTLPLTGGMGTMLLTLAGILLVGGAGCAFFAANRKKKAQAK
jgi:LPXTG-motif cell wall-anchored protein